VIIVLSTHHMRVTRPSKNNMAAAAAAACIHTVQEWQCNLAHRS
jgi:hypothetical protein